MTGSLPEGTDAARGGGEATAGSELRRAVLAATERISGIVDSAEEAARLIRAEAQEEARGIVADGAREAERMLEVRAAELAARLTPLTERLDGVRSEVAVIAAMLDDLLAQARAPMAPSRSAAAPVAPADVPRTAPPPQPDAEAAASDDGESERALLRATQMAVAGSGREEIERVLRDELGVGDPGPVVSRVLGAP